MAVVDRNVNGSFSESGKSSGFAFFLSEDAFDESSLLVGDPLLSVNLKLFQTCLNHFQL